MNKKALFVFLLLLSGPAFAWEPDMIRMKNGTVYEGYIAEQLPDGSIAIESEAETRTIERTADIRVDKMSGAYRIETPDGVFEKAEILEDGDWMTFRVCRAVRVSARLSEVEKIVFPVPDSLHRAQILQDVIETKGGASYTGTICELIPGQQMKISEDGRIVSVKLDNIKVQRRFARDMQVPMWEQSPYVNIFQFKNGTSLEGILVRQDYETGRLNIVTRDGIEHERNVQDVSRSGKRTNTDFNPELPIAVLADEIYVNGQSFVPIAFERKKEQVLLSVEQFQFNDIASGKLEIVMKKIDGNAPFLLPLSMSGIQKGGKIELFSLLEAFVGQISATEIVAGKDGQATLRFDALSRGNYVFYNPGVDTGLLLRVL